MVIFKETARRRKQHLSPLAWELRYVTRRRLLLIALRFSHLHYISKLAGNLSSTSWVNKKRKNFVGQQLSKIYLTPNARNRSLGCSKRNLFPLLSSKILATTMSQFLKCRWRILELQLDQISRLNPKTAGKINQLWLLCIHFSFKNLSILN